MGLLSKRHTPGRARVPRPSSRSLRVEPLESRRLLSLSITEFQASNGNTLEDAAGDAPDWIELSNTGDALLRIKGWYLTDDPADLTKWRIPATALLPDTRLIVFASGEDGYIGEELHAPFRLDAEGGYLALVAPGGQVIANQFAYPRQYTDVSYGTAEDGIVGYFAEPTPGRANGLAMRAPCLFPFFSEPSGTFVGELTLEMASLDPAATILYTTDGTDPAVEGTLLYTDPLILSETTFVRARVWRPGEGLGPLVEKTYVAVSPEVAEFNSNLPLVVVDTFGVDVKDILYDTPAFSVASAFIGVGDSGRATLSDTAEYAGRGGFKLRGESSTRKYEKHQYALETQDAFGVDEAVSLLGLPAESDWALYGPHSDKTLMRNYLVYKWGHEFAGDYAPRTVYFELFLDDNGNGVVDASDYHGVYMLIEKIKRDENRVDIERLTPLDNSGEAVTGGYIFKDDRLDPGDTGFVTSRGRSLCFVEPKEEELTPAQRDYLVGYINEFESVLYGSNFADPETGYAAYIDVASFIDHHIMIEWVKDVDGFMLSEYWYKDRDGKIVYAPLWDFNLSLGNANYHTSEDPRSWYYNYAISRGEYKWYGRLFQDPAFKRAYLDRWFELRRSVLSLEHMYADIDSQADFLRESAARNFEKWPVLGTYVWPNWYIGQTYQDEVDYLKSWIATRVEWIDAQLTAPPELSRCGGVIGPGAEVAMTLREGASGEIYYTLDGTDPAEIPIEPPLETTIFTRGSTWKYLDDGSDQGTAWREADFDDSNWASGAAELGYGDGNEATVVSYGPNPQARYATTYFRTAFTVDDVSSASHLELHLLHDDGAIVYLNGTELMRSRMNGGAIPFDQYASLVCVGIHEITYQEFTADASALVAGTNVLAVEIHQYNATSSDLSFDLEVNLFEVTLETGGRMRYDGAPVPLEDSALLTARAFNGTQWGAAAKAVYSFDPTGALRVSEVMYHPEGPASGQEQGYDKEAFEFVEVTNTSTRSIALDGYRLTDGVAFDFAAGAVTMLGPGESCVVVKDPAAFALRYGTEPLVAGTYTGNLRNSGERLTLHGPSGAVVDDFDYDDASPWPASADGDGDSLHRAAAAAFADDSHSWFAAAPTPGRVDWAPIPPGDLNGDGRVGGFDLDLIRAYWNQTVSRGNKSKGDLSGDGTVDSADLALLLTLWGTK